MVGVVCDVNIAAAVDGNATGMIEFGRSPGGIDKAAIICTACESGYHSPGSYFANGMIGCIGDIDIA